MKDSGVEWLGEVPEHWGVKRLKWSIALQKNGSWGEEPDDNGDIYLCVRVADFDRGRQIVSLDNPTYRKVTGAQSKALVLEQGDLLIEKSGGGDNWPVGFVVMYNHSNAAVCSNFVARMMIRSGCSSNYFKYEHRMLYAFRVNTRSIKQNTGIQNLDATSYFDHLATFPPLSEQHAIADYLDAETARIDALIAEAEETISLMQERRSALISACVTGKVKVPGVADPAAEEQAV
jgi:type I restriction enzyme S subunit